MPLNLTGATRVHFIIGDPIAQVKAPAGMTDGFTQRHHDAIMVPVQVAPKDLSQFMIAAQLMKNLDGILVTVPHKFACFAHCGSTSDRATLLGAVNIMRRRTNGIWHGDMVDGLGFVGALRAHGFDPVSKRALLIGAGGAGSAIGLALVDAGVSELAIHDADATRRDHLMARLATGKSARITIGSPDPTDFDLIANASPAGMRADDVLPFDMTKLSAATFVGCVITQPAVSPIIEAARRKGCATSTGTEMYQALQHTMIDFLLAT